MPPSRAARPGRRSNISELRRLVRRLIDGQPDHHAMTIFGRKAVDLTGRPASPRRAIRRGVTAGLLASIGAFYAFAVATKVEAAAPNVLVWPAAFVRLVQALAAAVAVAAVIALAQRISRLQLVLFLTLTVSLLFEYAGLPASGLLLLVLAAAALPALVFSGIAVWRTSRAAASSRARLLGAAAALSGIAGCALFAMWLLGDGRAATTAAAGTSRGAASLPPLLRAPDPSRPGPYTVETLSYGSGRDRWRAEYGSRARLVVPPVDGTALADGWTGFAGWGRTRFWGFSLSALPLQGRVWYPDGKGPFALVLVVHGSHPMEDFSEPGYAYLGELLASRGFVVVSVDENFLNTSYADVGLLPWREGRLRGEVDLRAFLLLEHLRRWREWNETPGHTFFGKVDLDDVALVGHSKGGEAVAVAAAFNRLRFHPDDARVAFDYGFGIRAVVAIAPTDGLYRPATQPTRLDDVDYLALQGANDLDVQSFAGARQFDRVSFSGADYFLKEAVYVLGANHGQFNTVWGGIDYSRARAFLANRRTRLPGDEQRRIAAVFVSAFLEVALHRQLAYVPFLEDPRTGREWLPGATLLTDFRDTATRIVASFDEDVDLTTTTLTGGRTRGDGLAVWRESVPRLRWGSRATSAVFLGWDGQGAGAPPSYGISLPDGTLDLDETSALVFSAADTGDRYPSRGDGTDATIDFTVELADRDGESVRLPLSAFSSLPSLPHVLAAKAACFADPPPTEPVFQSFTLPLASFVRAHPALRLDRLASVRLVFDRTSRHVIAIDDVGFRRPPSASEAARMAAGGS
jgi:dienelactone hydrolase